MPRSAVQRRAVVGVCRIDPAPVFKQEFHGCLVVAQCRVMQRRAATGVLGIKVTAFAVQQREHIQLAMRGGEVRAAAAMHISGGRGHSICDQCLYLDRSAMHCNRTGGA